MKRPMRRPVVGTSWQQQPKGFRVYRTKDIIRDIIWWCSAKHDRYEDIVKYSRNINIERNRIIFLLDPEDVEHFHRFHSPTPIRKPSTREIRCAAFLKCATLKVDLLDVKMMELPRISNDQAALHMSHESGSVGGIRIHQTNGTRSHAQLLSVICTYMV
ncbi:uncharacterized protein LOC109415907 [Aedes albopictus]|uniref:Uncharacterized protein n=1 Tax=Aedes albopictus TaxID=7160 RepID=A0ABM1YCK2_AEDAL